MTKPHLRGIVRPALGVAGVAAVLLAWRMRSDSSDAGRQPPSWEPAALERLATWVPPRPTTRSGRLAAYAWASPMSVVGLLVAATARTTPRSRDGVVVFAPVRGLAATMLRRRGFTAAALGHVIIALREPSDQLWRHELVHVRHAERLGPAFAACYLGLLAAYGYRNHPLERAARQPG